MKIDVKKLTFSDMDKTSYPLQAFFHYAMSEEEIQDWLSKEVSREDIPEEITITDVELAFTFFTKQDVKVEAICTSLDGTQFLVDVQEFMRSVDEFIALIPDFEKAFREVAPVV